MTATNKTPGCVVALLALFPAALSATACIALVKWSELPEPERPIDSHFWTLASCAAGGLLVTLAMGWAAVRIHRVTDYRRESS